MPSSAVMLVMGSWLMFRKSSRIPFSGESSVTRVLWIESARSGNPLSAPRSQKFDDDTSSSANGSPWSSRKSPMCRPLKSSRKPPTDRVEIRDEFHWGWEV